MDYLNIALIVLVVVAVWAVVEVALTVRSARKNIDEVSASANEVIAQAQPIVAEGRELQRAFADRLAEGLSAEDLAHFRRCVAIFDRNIEQIRAEKSKRTEIQNP